MVQKGVSYKPMKFVEDYERKLCIPAPSDASREAAEWSISTLSRQQIPKGYGHIFLMWLPSRIPQIYLNMVLVVVEAFIFKPSHPHTLNPAFGSHTLPPLTHVDF